MTSVSYCTPEWLEESAKAYRSDPKFRESLKKLTAKLCFRVKADPALGIEKDILFGTFFAQGELTRIGFFTEEQARQEADFILAATPGQWGRILRKESKFTADFMLGKITLDMGDKVRVVTIAPHSTPIVNALTSVQVRFPDEMSPQEIADYRDHMERFRSELGV